MGRDIYRTPEEDVTAEFQRVCQLFQLALGKPSDRVLFDSLMGEASEHGLNWIEGLEYVIEQRQGADHASDPAAQSSGISLSHKKRPPCSTGLPVGEQLRKAG